MKVHSDVVFREIHWRIPAEVADRFAEVAKKHKTTTCHIGYTFMKAVNKGDETGLVDFAAKNPLIIQMISLFGGKPRGRNKYNLLLAADQLSQVVSCSQLIHKDWNEGKLGWCEQNRRWVTVQICQTCKDQV